MMGPFAVDMYLPAFGAIGSEFDAAPIAIQQTLSVYMFAFAFMMLWHGALSDALGRRPIILGGLVIYALGTLGCAIAGNIQSLWLMRAIAGAVRRRGRRGRTGDHPRPLPRRGGATDDVADHAAVRDRARARARRGRGAAQLARVALDLLGAVRVVAGAAGAVPAVSARDIAARQPAAAASARAVAQLSGRPHAAEVHAARADSRAQLLRHSSSTSPRRRPSWWTCSACRPWASPGCSSR